MDYLALKSKPFDSNLNSLNLEIDEIKKPLKMINHANYFLNSEKKNILLIKILNSIPIEV